MVKTIKNIRLKNYNYTSDSFYYVTICSNYITNFTEKEKCIIEKYIREIENIVNGVKIDFYEIVSNHLHLILVMNECKMSLGEIIRRFKAKSSKEAGKKLWQPNYFEHVIRSEKALEKIREYIKNNPLKEKLEFDKIYEKTNPDKSATTKN